MTEKSKKIVVYSGLSEKYGWIRSMGSKLDLDVMVVRDGEEAVQACRAQAPAFALLDVSMPRAGGIECTRMIKDSGIDTKIILMSNINSLSLQDGAKDAFVDLYVVDSVASIKVPEFIRAKLSDTELPPEAVEEIEREILSKRGSQRFPFEGEVQFRMEDKWHSGVLVNVSQDGLLFQTHTAVPLGSNLVLSWMDEGLKHIEVTGIVVRQLSSAHLQYPFMTGVQFLKTSAVLEQTVAELSENADLFDEGAEIEMDMDLMERLFSKSRHYFQELFHGGKAPLFVESSITDVVEHERNAFLGKDVYSICLQEIVAAKIISHMIENAANQIAELKTSNNFRMRLLILTSELLEKIKYIEEDSDALVFQSVRDQATEERRRLNESSNRLYNAKALMLDTFCKKIKREAIPESLVGGYDEVVRHHDQLVSYKKHLEEISRTEDTQRKETATLRAIKPVESSPKQHAAPQARNSVSAKIPLEKQSILPYFAGAILLLALLPSLKEIALMKFSSTSNIVTMLEPNSTRRNSDTGLTIDVSPEAWDKLDDNGRKMMLDQIEIYLTKNNMQQCKIVSGDRMIAAVYASTTNEFPGFLRHIFLNDEIAAASSAQKFKSLPSANEQSMDGPAPTTPARSSRPGKRKN